MKIQARSSMNQLSMLPINQQEGHGISIIRGAVGTPRPTFRRISGSKRETLRGILSRRAFLARSSVVAATITIVPRHVLGGAGQVTPGSKLNLAVIGAGGR